MLLETDLGGNDLQFISAFWQALLRARGAKLAGLSLGSSGLAGYVVRVIQYPWLLQASATRTRQERRSQRLQQPPLLEHGCVLYRSDGARRGQYGIHDSGTVASYASVCWDRGIIVGRCAGLLQDASTTRPNIQA